MNSKMIKSKLNPSLEVVAFSGHFATRHSHNTHYIDITRMKHEFTMAREAAITLAQRYAYEKGVDTIVCLDGSEVIGAFLARHLSKNDYFSINRDKNINVVTPEYDSNGQLIFRDNRPPCRRMRSLLRRQGSGNCQRVQHPRPCGGNSGLFPLHPRRYPRICNALPQGVSHVQGGTENRRSFQQLRIFSFLKHDDAETTIKVVLQPRPRLKARLHAKPASK